MTAASSHLRVSTVAALLVTASVFVQASDTHAPRFKNGVDLVSLDVCVRDTSGRFLPGLAAHDFQILENGRPQRIAFIESPGGIPLRVVLVIDRSASMIGAKLQRAIDAASAFAALLEPEDQLEILTFNERAVRVHDFTDDPARISSTLASIQASGMTALYDALLVAERDLLRARRGSSSDAREVVIVLSDGEDTASLIGFDEVLPALRRSGALVYGVSLRTSERGEWLGATWPLLDLAVDTGARAVGVPSLDGLVALYRQINVEVRNLYRIGYVSDDIRRDGQWRSLAVRVVSTKATVQARGGYYASRRP